jgi:hypothetical protein
MTLQIETNAYDPAVYGKPWLAKVTFEKPSGNFQWGDFAGASGEPGVIVLPDVNPGDVVARGQKEWENSHNSAPTFYRVTEDGELEKFETRAAAWRHWQALFNPTQP